jgi:hypothetical protein
VDLDALRALIDEQAALMVAVATGGPRIEQENRRYQGRRREIASELRRLGLEDPNPFRDLWGWYGYWAQHLPNYRSRREYVRELYVPLLDALENLAERRLGTDLHPAQSGWAAVDHQLSQLRERFALAITADDHKAIGLLCRDVFRSLADATFDENAHLPSGEQLPGPADSVARLHLVVDAVAPSEANREIRKVLKANLDLANKVQHDQTGTAVQAALVAEATIASLNMLRTMIPAEPEPLRVPGVDPPTDDDMYGVVDVDW